MVDDDGGGSCSTAEKVAVWSFVGFREVGCIAGDDSGLVVGLLVG